MNGFVAKKEMIMRKEKFRYFTLEAEFQYKQTIVLLLRQEHRKIYPSIC